MYRQSCKAWWVHLFIQFYILFLSLSPSFSNKYTQVHSYTVEAWVVQLDIQFHILSFSLSNKCTHAHSNKQTHFIPHNISPYTYCVQNTHHAEATSILYAHTHTHKHARVHQSCYLRTQIITQFLPYSGIDGTHCASPSLLSTLSLTHCSSSGCIFIWWFLLMLVVTFAFLFGAVLQIPCDEVRHPSYNGFVKVRSWRNRAS